MVNQIFQVPLKEYLMCFYNCKEIYKNNIGIMKVICYDRYEEIIDFLNIHHYSLKNEFECAFEYLNNQYIYGIVINDPNDLIAANVMFQIIKKIIALCFIVNKS